MGDCARTETHVIFLLEAQFITCCDCTSYIVQYGFWICRAFGLPTDVGAGDVMTNRAETETAEKGNIEGLEGSRVHLGNDVIQTNYRTEIEYAALTVPYSAYAQASGRGPWKRNKRGKVRYRKQGTALVHVLDRTNPLRLIPYTTIPP